jgi:hypothetical protein
MLTQIEETKNMKLTGVVRMLILISLLGTTALIYAQDQRDETTPRQQEDAKPQRQDEAKPSREDGKPGNQEAKPSKQAEHAEQSAQHVQRGHIPDDKFRAHFGRQHTVVINRPIIVEGQPRFQYGGYWFNIIDAWPAGWAYTDQCYIDYIDGEYFLFDLLHPGVRVAIVVVL